MIGKRKRGVTEPRPPRPVPSRPKIPPMMVFRMFVLGAVSIVACVWAIWRHYTVPRSPMLVPVPTATEIEIEPPP